MFLWERPCFVCLVRAREEVHAWECAHETHSFNGFPLIQVEVHFNKQLCWHIYCTNAIYSFTADFTNSPHGNVYLLNSTQYLAVHKKVPYTSSIVFVLQLWVFVGYILVHPSKLQYMTSIQIPVKKNTTLSIWVNREEEKKTASCRFSRFKILNTALTINKQQQQKKRNTQTPYKLSRLKFMASFFSCWGCHHCYCSLTTNMTSYSWFFP